MATKNKPKRRFRVGSKVMGWGIGVPSEQTEAGTVISTTTYKKDYEKGLIDTPYYVTWKNLQVQIHCPEDMVIRPSEAKYRLGAILKK